MDLDYNVIIIESSGEEAIKIAEENILDLILMDIIFKGCLDGIQISKQIRKPYDVKIIFVTEYSSKEISDELTVIKSFSFVYEPFDEDKI